MEPRASVFDDTNLVCHEAGFLCNPIATCNHQPHQVTYSRSPPVDLPATQLAKPFNGSIYLNYIHGTLILFHLGESSEEAIGALSLSLDMATAVELSHMQ